jgi:hypothetical protein
VPEDRLQDAIDVLRPLFMMTRRSYTILRETEEHIYEDSLAPEEVARSSNQSTLKDSLQDKPPSPMASYNQRHPFAVMPYRVYLTSIHKYLLKNVVHTLLQLIFYTQR